MMKAGNIIYIKEYPEGYTEAVIKSVSTHSFEGYEYGHPIASMIEHDLIRERDGVWWER